MDEEDLAWARFQHEIYMSNLITIIVEGDMTALVRYAMDLDLWEREGAPTTTPSGSAGSGSSTDGAAQFELSDPTSRQALVGIGRIFETVANHITAYRNDPERGYILRYPMDMHNPMWNTCTGSQPCVFEETKRGWKRKLNDSWNRTKW